MGAYLVGERGPEFFTNTPRTRFEPEFMDAADEES